MERLTEKITDKRTGEVLAYRVKCQKDVEAVQKLGRLEGLEEQGKLLRLPCAVGDTVYIAKGREVSRNYVVQIHVSQTEAQTFFSCYDYCFGIEQIGKTVFLTREEAEIALKELKSKEIRK